MSDVAQLIEEGLAHIRAGRVPDAARAFERVLHIDKNNPDAMHELGLLHYAAGRSEHARVLLERAAAAAPQVPLFQRNLGVLRLKLKQPAGALEAFDRTLVLLPDDPPSLEGRAAALLELRRFREASDLLERLVRRQPDSKNYIRLGSALQEQLRLDEALDAFNHARRLDPSPANDTPALLCMNYHDRFTPREIFAAHEAFGRRFPAPAAPAVHVNALDRPLRIGYLSPDFRQHSVAFFIWPILMHHDGERVHITCYSDVGKPDAITEIMKNYPQRWRATWGVADARVAEMVREDQIDILVDLTGQTADNRLPLLATRVAPIQINYLGYPNTTGVRAIDYRITDRFADPPGQTESLHTETLLRMPNSFFCYVTPADLPDVNPLPALARGGAVTFAIFTNFAKVRPAVMELWARILHAVPKSRLLIQATALHDPLIRETIAKFFIDRGIGAERIELRGFIEFPQFVRQFADVDIILDTFPFNGHTSTCHALWMGVPVVTLAGPVHRSRMGLSILTNLGLRELVAHDTDQYVQIAADLARDTSRLSALRTSLRQRMRESPLLDGKTFTRDLEDVFAHVAAAR